MAACKVPGFCDARGHAHCDLLMHGANAGIAGIPAALALLWSTVLVCWRAGRRQAAAAWLPLAAVFVQVGVTVTGLFQVHQTDDEVEILLYPVLGCAKAVVVAGGRTDAGVRDSVPIDARERAPNPTQAEVDP